MNISSYNVTDVGYHYIGLRVLAATPDAEREEQFAAVAKNVAKYARDKALRLLLPEPRGDFTSVGEKVLQELNHLCLARPLRSKGYELTELGTLAVQLLNSKKHPPLRRMMAKAHLETYDNLRDVVLGHVTKGPLLNPIVEAARGSERPYLVGLMRPSFGERADDVVNSIEGDTQDRKDRGVKKVEDAMRAAILDDRFPNTKLSVPLFRAMVDRLVTLRLLNVMRWEERDCEFAKSYSPCVESPVHSWHKEMLVTPEETKPFVVYLSEPDIAERTFQDQLLGAVVASFDVLPHAAGYHDLPDVRDFVCERLLIPEAAFDEGVNALLDRQPSPLTVGLQYERISGRRKPLVRTREATQIYNLIRRA